MMNQRNSEIQISRKNGTLMSVTVAMPIRQRVDYNKHIIVSLPFLGGLETTAINNEDVKIAVSELIECYCIAAEKFGEGIVKELKSVGWVDVKSKNKDEIVMIRKMHG